MSVNVPKDHVVGVADCKFARGDECVLTTFALGSCLGITFYDVATKTGALLHAMLPAAKERKGDQTKRFMFLDVGVPLVLKTLNDKGVSVRNLECKVFGGARVLKGDKFFNIGQNNVEAFQVLSAKYGLRVKVWEVGGQVNRTIKCSLENGKVKVRTPGRGEFFA